MRKIISKIKIGDKEILNQTGIKLSFYNFYKKLFQQQKIKVQDVNDYLAKIKVRTATNGMRQLLNYTIKIEEIGNAINL